MSDTAKWSKECKDCGRRYPTSCGVATCLACKSELGQTQKIPTVSEDEWKDLCFIHGRTIPGPLSDEEREKTDQDWAALEAEVLKRGERWTIPDLLEEDFLGRSVRTV